MFIGLHLYDISKVGKSTKTECRLVVAELRRKRTRDHFEWGWGRKGKRKTVLTLGHGDGCPTL